MPRAATKIPGATATRVGATLEAMVAAEAAHPAHGGDHGFRATMRLLASTVAVVTASHQGQRGGLTATSVCSLSAEPPLMFICINRRSNTHVLIEKSGALCVNYLAEPHEALARHFANQVEDPEAKFKLGTWETSPLGNPVLADGLATIDCRVSRHFDEGTHTVFIASVVGTTARHDLSPLIYVRNDFTQLKPRA